MSLHDILRGDIMPLSGVAISIGRNTYDPPAPTVPVFDIHARSYILYDSGAPSQSGIVQFNSSENRLEMIPAGSGAQPVETAVRFDAYDSTGGQALSSPSTIVLNLDTERVNTHPNIYVLASDELQINAAGSYEFIVRVSGNTSSGTRTTSFSALERQAPGGSYTEVAASRSYMYNRNSASGEGTTFMILYLDDVVAGEKFRVIAGQENTSVVGVSTLANASSLTVKKWG